MFRRRIASWICWPERRPTAARDTHQQMVEDMIRIFEAQKLVSLSTLFDLADNLESVQRGEKLNTALAGKLASRISEIQLPRNTLTTTEKNSMSFGYWTDKHVEAQRKLNLRAAIEKAGQRCQEAEGPARHAGAVPARHAGGIQLHSLRAAGRAGAAHQSAVRSQPRFYRHPGGQSNLEADRGVRHRLARQRRRTAGGIARVAALRAGRSASRIS